MRNPHHATKRLAALTTLAALTLTGCGTNSVPDIGDTINGAKSNATPKGILCASTGLYIDRLDTGGKTTKQAARLIAQAANDPNVTKAANIIANNPTDKASLKVLRQAAQRVC